MSSLCIYWSVICLKYKYILCILRDYSCFKFVKTEYCVVQDSVLMCMFFSVSVFD